MSRVRSCVSLGWSDRPFREVVRFTMASYLQGLVYLILPSMLACRAREHICCRERYLRAR